MAPAGWLVNFPTTSMASSWMTTRSAWPRVTRTAWVLLKKPAGASTSTSWSPSVRFLIWSGALPIGRPSSFTLTPAGSTMRSNPVFGSAVTAGCGVSAIVAPPAAAGAALGDGGASVFAAVFSLPPSSSPPLDTMMTRMAMAMATATVTPICAMVTGLSLRVRGALADR